MTTRAQLVLDMAKRARTPADADEVSKAVGRIVVGANHAELDLLNQALALSRTVMDAYLEKRIVDFRRAGSG